MNGTQFRRGSHLFISVNLTDEHVGYCKYKCTPIWSLYSLIDGAVSCFELCAAAVLMCLSLIKDTKRAGGAGGSNEELVSRLAGLN